MRSRFLRIFAILGVVVLATILFQGPLAAAALPSDPDHTNQAAASSGATATASTWSTGYEPAKAIDGSSATAWRPTTTDALVVDFVEEVDLREIHVHLVENAMPTVELYLKDAAGGYSLVQSWSGNTALDLVHTISPGASATGVKVAFPTALEHTHSYIHTHQECTYWHWHSGGPTPMGGGSLVGMDGGYPHCHSWTSSDHVHYYTDTHYAQVAEVEAWGVVPDADGDGLGDAFEEGVRYRQEAIVAGLPVDVPDNGADVLVIPLERPLWSGVATAAFLDLKVNHAYTGDLVAAVGYWDGSAWDDRLAWVPGDFANSSIWDTTVVEHLHPYQFCTEWHIHSFPEGEYPHCHASETRYYSHLHNYPSIPAAGGTGGQLSLSTSWSPTVSASAASGSVSHITIDLRKAVLEAWEEEAGFRTPAFPQAELQGRTQWRLLVRDWNPYRGSGSLLSARLLTEERSDPATADTDGDGVLEDGEEVALGAFPVALDTDWDDLSDVFEKDAHALTLTIDGATITRSVETNPADGDSDGDGLGDGEEWSPGLDSVITDPTVADTDGDGLEDGEEAMVHYSNATLTDTDRDGFADNVEVNPRSLTLNVNGAPETRSVTTLPYAEDSDGDGLGDYEEFEGISVYGVKTDPSDPDTDGDGLPDGQERFTAEVSLDKKYTIGTYVQPSLYASISGRLESATIRYATSGMDARSLRLTLYHAGRTITLRDHEGSGSYLTASHDLTGQFSYYFGSYYLNVYSDSPGGLLEDATLSFTLLTSPVKEDTDGDGLNDTEEVTHGADAWITDPNRWDSDGDGWNDGYESLTAGTSPLARDTDGDGANDPQDIDPFRNLLIKVKVKQAHHGGAWWDPELAVVILVNEDHTWVTKHECGCSDHTASFYYSYYADVPDDASAVSVRASAWSFNWWGDDLIEDGTVSYTLGSGRTSYYISGGSSWITIDVSTTYLRKVHTLALTDGNVAAQADNGQHRYVAQDRYFVFLVEATDSYSTINAGMHAFVVPRALYMESRLKDRIDRGYTWPLDTSTDPTATKFYAEDTAQTDMSEAVAAVTAGPLSGYRTYWLLQYLLQDASGSDAYQAIDVTYQVAVLNLPTDALQIIPWVGVTNGPTGAEPADFWTKLTAAVTAVVNVMVQVGQLIYGGLIAIGNFFVTLGEAIVDWGMQLVGTFGGALAAINVIIAKTAEVMGSLLAWVWDAIVSLVQAVKNAVVNAVLSYAQSVQEALSAFLARLMEFQSIQTTETTRAVLMTGIAFSLSFFGLQALAQPITDILLTVQRLVEPLGSVLNPFQVSQAVSSVFGGIGPPSAASLFGTIQGATTQALGWLFSLDIGSGGLLDTLGVYSVQPVDSSAYSALDIDTFILFAQTAGLYGGIVSTVLDAAVSALASASLPGDIATGIVVALGLTGLTYALLFGGGVPLNIIGKVALVAGGISIILTVIAKAIGNIWLSLVSMLYGHFNVYVSFGLNIEALPLILISILELFAGPIAFALG